MRTAALILGIIGGILGIIAGILAMIIGGVGVAFEAEDAGMIGGLGFVAIIFGVAGVVGGALANRNPKLAASLELAAGLFGFIAVSMFWIPAGLCLIVGALLAFLGRKQRPQEVVAP
ncbi:DUF4064 domain-containing protein [Nitrolancea hollandica]|uniref:Putative membrane protein n=1 Tax=Nitrolancea hollandica Lb TaxID=1129897 RepID=I4EN38_9BACT|nr:DUF4064 domain-containing protein [Nitrolancea hollandica]CCF86101.1 putative membrane protein [Nitrolancea hollandica Lb]